MGFIPSGYPDQIQFGTINTTASYNYYQAYYVTDTWQAKPNLTLNLGLRYELPGAVAERNNKATVLLPHAVDPYTGVTGTLTLVDTLSIPTGAPSFRNTTCLRRAWALPIACITIR